MRAPQLCDLASDWLAERYPDALIVRELSVGKWGKALIDIVAICEDHLVGVEIKGDGDSHARLELQGWIYSRVASRMFLLTAPALDKSAGSRLPEGWWHLRVSSAGICPGSLGGYGAGPSQQPNAPAQMLECLIGKELKTLARAICPTVDHGTTVGQMIAAISENAPLRDIRRGVCSALRARDWLRYDRSIGVHRPNRYRWADGRSVEIPHIQAHLGKAA